LLVCCASCATIRSTNNYVVTIDSDIQLATYTIYDERNNVLFSGLTPDSVKLRAGKPYFKRNKYIVKYQLSPYPDQLLKLEPTVDKHYWWSIPIGLLGAIFIDPVIGAMYELDDVVRASFDD